MTACCGVRGCDERFEPGAGKEQQGHILFDCRRTFFPICRRHRRWMDETCGPDLDATGRLFGSAVERVGPNRARWLHDHCLPAVRLDGGIPTAADAEDAAKRRWPAP